MSDGPKRIPLPDESAIFRLASQVVQSLAPGSLLVLSGPLGSGKTTLVKSLARALGSAADVTSPTYALVHEYPTPSGTLAHLDAYRLPSATVLFDLGLSELQERSRLTVVEWGEALIEHEPTAYHLALDRSGDPSEALHGALWRSWPGRSPAER